MKPGEHGILRMQIGHGCVGPHAYTLAYGLLRRPGDTVIAHVGGDRGEVQKDGRSRVSRCRGD